MTIKSHVIAGTGLATAILAGMDILYAKDFLIFQGVEVGNFVLPKLTTSDLISPVFDLLFWTDSPVKFYVYLFISACVFITGALIPDIDTKNSFMSKNFLFLKHIEHRTITHTMWIVIIFSCIGLLIPISLWFAFGIFIHILLDSFSSGGICFFWPLSKYRHYGDNGAKVKKGHIFKLYKTGKPSEGVFCIILLLVCLMIDYLWIRVRFM